ncbi:MAG: histidine phosphatase family protein [Nitrososphaeraceae archaeon]|nr:histidine phosphatase family protein [Nitrososphaeraceae archaeon]
MSRSGGLNRPLTYTGTTEIKSIADSIRKLRIKIDLILTSPLSSCKQTGEIINDLFKKRIPIIICNDLKPEGKLLDFYNKISEYKDTSSILIVGHEPYLSSMINDIISNNADTDRNYNTNHNNIILKKAGLSRIKITSTVPKLKGELRWLLTPRILKKLS